MAGNRQTFSDWQGGYDPQADKNSMALLGPTPTFRSVKDRQLVAFGASPDTQYPDGYLGGMDANRRQDKLMKAVQRTQTRPYSRGIHKGERINPGDYVWPKEFNLMSGLENQLTGMRFASQGAEPVQLTNDGKAGPRGIPRGIDRPDQEFVDLQRRSMLKTLLPSWR